MAGHDEGTRKPVPYKVFTTEFDKVVHANELAFAVVGRVTPIFGEDTRDGLLPEAVGAAAAVSAGLPAYDGTVQVLLDMSGSNRGTHVDTIRTVDVVARALEASGIPFEVLGYTTSSWKGGQSRRKWNEVKAGLQWPGRLCDLQHVVFKETDIGWDESRRGQPSPAALLDAVYRPPHMRENVDGEALRWARSRHGGGEVRMLCFADGNSIDDSTLANNPASLLSDDRERALTEMAADGIEPVFVRFEFDHRLAAPDDLAFERGTDPAEVAAAALGRLLEPAPSPAP